VLKLFRSRRLTHQCACEQILLADGNNQYKLPHMGKEKLMRSGQLPLSIRVTEQLRDKIHALQVRPTQQVVLEVPEAAAEEEGTIAQV
jgi:hypothetical protein